MTAPLHLKSYWKNQEKLYARFSLKSSLYWNLQNYEAAKPHFHAKPHFISFKSTANTSCSQRNPHNLLHHRPNQTNFGTNGLRALGPQIWNGLQNVMKSDQNIQIFKRLIRQREGLKCNCNVCQYETHWSQLKLNAFRSM